MINITYAQEPDAENTQSTQEQTPTEKTSDTAHQPTGQFVKNVTLGALDKVTARVTKLPMKVGETRKFGNIIIHVIKCWQSNPEDMPDTKAFLEITETKKEKEPQVIFKGWMFASNPSLKALEHPVYDVWVIQGVSTSPTEEPSIPSKASEDKVDEMLQQILQTPQE